MLFAAAPIEIPEAVHPILFRTAKNKTLPARQVQRAKLILLATDDLDNMQISKKIGLGQDSVSKWRSCFLKNLLILQETAEKAPSHLKEAVAFFLNDCPHPRQPVRYTDEQS